ncbi:MAG TPA: MotA/TolQ/ExbB proton channel family protein [Nevskiaceae bacterium]|nr:MotA/TolQ/ExbB proton channel family protein [Nevskiaceae bacterium]
MKTLFASLLLAVSGATLAQSPASVDELLQRVEQGIVADQQAQRARLAEFEREKDRQADLLAASREELKALEARSASLETRYASNEAKLGEEEARLNERLGSLRELFGVLQQTTGEFKGVVLTSAISSQYPGREAVLDALIAKAGAQTTFPSIEEIEQLWFEMQREITAAGKTQRYSAEVVDAAGKPIQTEVVRVGSFTLLANGRFLVVDPDSRKLVELAKQPHGEVIDSAGRFFAAPAGGLEWLWVDPSRGVLLTLQGERPDFWGRIEQGGLVGAIIIAVGLFGAGAAIYQFIFLTVTQARVRRQLAAIGEPSQDNPLGRVLATFKQSAHRDDENAEVIELRLSEAVMREVPALERFQALLKLVVAAGPLLGLVGTVIGMIITFQAITEAGSSDPKLMADGISHAMVATALGLGIAIPLLFANAVLVSRSKRIVQVLDEQTAGMLAEWIEANEQAAKSAKA